MDPGATFGRLLATFGQLLGMESTILENRKRVSFRAAFRRNPKTAMRSAASMAAPRRMRVCFRKNRGSWGPRDREILKGERGSRGHFWPAFGHFRPTFGNGKPLIATRIRRRERMKRAHGPGIRSKPPIDLFAARRGFVAARGRFVGAGG